MTHRPRPPVCLITDMGTVLPPPPHDLRCCKQWSITERRYLCAGCEYDSHMRCVLQVYDDAYPTWINNGEGASNGEA